MTRIIEVFAGVTTLATNALFWSMDEAWNLGGESLLPPLFATVVSVVTGALLVLW